MEWKGKYKSELMMVCHMDAKAMHEAGVINDKEMQEYDRDCLIYTPDESKRMKASNQKPTPVYTSSNIQNK